MVDLSLTVSDVQKDRLRRILDDKDDVDRVLEIVLTAGAMEALAYATGETVPSTMSELRMYRVTCLLNAGMRLDEVERLVAVLFKLSSGGARRIVAATLSRYAFELRENTTAEIVRLLESATWDAENDRWEIGLPTGFAREQILDMCRQSTQPDPVKRFGAVWAFPHETYTWVRSRSGLSERTQPA